MAKKIMTCEIAFVPVQSHDYIAEVDAVLDIIRESGLEYNIGEMSTIIKGESYKIFALMERIYNDRYDKSKFIISVRMSNVCGC
jgi:uncharacterized protein YqgV (UPF0045/DUF77 family)